MGSACILVAMRTWITHWLNCQCTLAIKSINISALLMASKLKVTSSALASQELALIVSEASHASARGARARRDECMA